MRGDLSMRGDSGRRGQLFSTGARGWRNLLLAETTVTVGRAEVSVRQWGLGGVPR